jgi:2-methylcitrate dehydratase PrpD
LPTTPPLDLRRHGLTGPPTVLEGRFGFLQAFCGDRAHPDAVVRGLGTDRELPRVVFKQYPCNHFTHAGADAALRLRAQGLAPADVTAIELGVAKPVLRTIAELPEATARPVSGYHAGFSGRYTVAAALLGGGLGAVLRVTTRNGRGTRSPRRGQPRRPRQPPVRRGAGEEVPRQRREVPPGGARGRARGPNARPS